MITLFCDIDGVFTNARTGWFTFDLQAVNFIRWVCKHTGAKIVLSSSWRYAHSKIFFNTIFGAENLHKDWRTPAKLTSSRGDEIAMWLQNRQNIDAYIILDDDTDFHHDQLPFFVQTDIYDGLSLNNMFDIMTRLGIDKTHNPWSGDAPMEYYIHKNMFDSRHKIYLDM